MKTLTFGILVSALLLSSCAKDGEDGAQGPPGNANVTSTTFMPAQGLSSSGTLP